MAMNPSLQPTGSDRRLYVWFAVFMPIIVLAGFARSYYLKGFFGFPALPSLLVHLHGIVMTSWVVLFVTQVTLVATGRTRTHQRLGLLGAVLAPLVIVVGVLTAIAGAARGSTPGPPALQFLAVPLFDMLAFAILVGTALYFRRRRLDIHKRLMLLAAANLLPPAIVRIPLHFIETGGPLVFFGLTDVCLLACVAYDTVKNRRLHPAFLWGTLLIIASQPLRLMLAGTDVWMRFATMLVGLVK
ncbi:MAG TPA: hypothetical protein VK117_04485 [Pyrinomonadaceae bacterium]|nr:hypothetical protein [Pyrinomonadaceae bacterium]